MNKLALLALGTALTGVSMAASFSVSGAGGDIPDNDVTGISTSGSFAGLPGTITSLTSVTLTGLTHTWIGDLRAYLSYGGSTFMLFQHPGTTGSSFGHSDNFNVGDYTFDVVSAQTVDQACAASTNINPGSYRAAGQADLLAVVPGPNGNLMTGNEMNGLDPNGSWTLTIIDRAGGDTGTFTGWTAVGEYTPVPEPASMIALGAGALALVRRRRSK